MLKWNMFEENFGPCDSQRTGPSGSVMKIEINRTTELYAKVYVWFAAIGWGAALLWAVVKVTRHFMT